MSSMRSNGAAKLPSPGAAIIEVGITNLDHFAAFIQQGGFPERYGEWLKARFDFCERVRTVVTDRKGRHKIVSHIDSIHHEEAGSGEAGIAEYAENSEEAPDSYESYHSSEKD